MRAGSRRGSRAADSTSRFHPDTSFTSVAASTTVEQDALPDFNDVFPHPCIGDVEEGSRQTTRAAASRVAAIVAACCCAPGLHALLIHESLHEGSAAAPAAANPGSGPSSDPAAWSSKQQLVAENIRSIATDDAKYISLVVTSSTTREDIADALLRAELNSASFSTISRTLAAAAAAASSSHMLQRRRQHGRQLSNLSSEGESSLTSDVDGSPSATEPAGPSALTHASPPSAADPTIAAALGGAPRPAVVLVHDIHNAVPVVISALCDAMCFAQVQANTATGTTTRRLSRVRIVGLCDSAFLPYLPAHLRSCFTLSATVPLSALLGAPTPRNSRGGTAVNQPGGGSKGAGSLNRVALQELISRSGCYPSMLDDPGVVFASTATERYLRQLLTATRGAIAVFQSCAPHAMRRTSDMMRVASIMALLFSNYGSPQSSGGGAGHTRAASAAATASTPRRVLVTPHHVVCLLPHFLAHLVTASAGSGVCSGSLSVGASIATSVSVNGSAAEAPVWGRGQRERHEHPQARTAPIDDRASAAPGAQRTAGPSPSSPAGLAAALGSWDAVAVEQRATRCRLLRYDDVHRMIIKVVRERTLPPPG